MEQKVFSQPINELTTKGFCVLKNHLPLSVLEACREALWPILTDYIAARSATPNRGPNRFFLPMPFESPCYAPAFFFDQTILGIVHGLMDDRIVIDQWGCDAPIEGSTFQPFHVDYQRPLFAEVPDLPLPPYLLVVSFGLLPIRAENGPIEIAPGTHRMPRNEALHAVETGQIIPEPALMAMGDVLIRHPWAIHRGTPNQTNTPRPLLTIRYVRRWYMDESRPVNSIPAAVWKSMNVEQQNLMRFPRQNG